MSKLELPQPEQMSDERYFEIRNCGSDGCGSFHTFTVSGDTLVDEIMRIACAEHNDYMNSCEERYIPSVFSSPPYWRPTIKVIEMKRTIYKLDPVKDAKRIERTGRDYGNDWSTKRGGLKFRIVNSYMRVKTNLGVKQFNGYKPGGEL